MGALHDAVRTGSAGDVRRLLDEGADVSEAEGWDTPLLIAARLGHLEVARLLLERGAILTPQDRLALGRSSGPAPDAGEERE